MTGLGWLPGTVIETNFSPAHDRRLRELLEAPGIDVGLGIAAGSGRCCWGRPARWRSSVRFSRSIASRATSSCSARVERCRRRDEMERTLTIIKPDSVAAGNAGKILAHLEAEGFHVLAMRRLQMSEGAGSRVLRGPQGAALLRRSGRVHDQWALHRDGPRAG